MIYPVFLLALGGAGALVVATCVGAIFARLGFPLPDERRRLGRIDGLRGYLALAVMVHHFVIWLQITRLGGSWSPPTIALFNSLGSGGVALFFMTTGFVFYPRVLAGLKATDWKATYISRLFRLYPLMIVALAMVCGIVAYQLGGSLAGDWRINAKALALWLSCKAEPPLFGFEDSGRINAYVLWSLWFEWIFYFLILPALALVRDLIRGWLPSWTVPAAMGGAALLWSGIGHPPAIIPYLPLFAAGMIAFELRSRPKIASILATPAAAILGGLGLAAAASLTPVAYGVPQIIAYAFFFACLACDNGFGGLFALKGAIVLGECSFGIYLLHGLVLYILFAIILPQGGALPMGSLIALLPLVGLVVVLLSGAMHLLVERPGIRMGKLVAGLGKRQPRSATDAAALEVAP